MFCQSSPASFLPNFEIGFTDAKSALLTREWVVRMRGANDYFSLLPDASLVTPGRLSMAAAVDDQLCGIPRVGAIGVNAMVL